MFWSDFHRSRQTDLTIAADGYTLLLAATANTINATLYDKLTCFGLHAN
jgi:hypothetical protein